MAPRQPQTDENDDALEDDDVEGQENGVASEEGDEDGLGDEGQGEQETSDEGSEGDGETRLLDEPRQPAKRETAVTRAQRLAREARSEAEVVRREAAELRAEMQRLRQPVQETPEQEAARLALMDPEQRVEHRFNKAMERQNRAMAEMQARLADQSDKSTFASLCVSNSFYRQVKDDVEKKLVEIRRMGQNVDREALAKYIIGERVLARGPKKAQQQQTQGNRNIQRQRAVGSAGRSDQGASNEDRRQAERRRRLEDVTF